MKNALSYIHPNAKIGKNATIEPFVNIKEDVIIGDNVWIGSNVSIMNGSRIGDNCKIFPGAVIGAVPQDLKFSGEDSTLEIGNNVTIREYCTLNRGTKASHRTIINDNSLLMAYVHVAHDCSIGRNCVLANNATLAGHISVGDFSILGGMVAVHQFVTIGEHCMIGGGSLVSKDVPHFVKAARYPLAYVGVNSIGLRRRGFESEIIHHIQDIYRYMFAKGMNTTQALNAIVEEIKDSETKTKILDFVRNSNRGLIKSYRHINGRK